MLLRDIQQRCPGLTTDLLMPRPPDWMRQDVLAYEAIQRGRLAGAKAVHLPATKLSPAVVSAIRSHGFDIHVWDVNDDETLAHMLGLGIRRGLYRQRPTDRQRCTPDDLDNSKLLTIRERFRTCLLSGGATGGRSGDRLYLDRLGSRRYYQFQGTRCLAHGCIRGNR